MQIEIIFFGQLVDRTNCASVFLENPGTIAMLRTELIKQYPKLNDASFTIAVNNKIASDQTIILDHAKIALMPPFSGG
jgi:molybdopterin converting factor small subunit